METFSITAPSPPSRPRTKRRGRVWGSLEVLTISPSTTNTGVPATVVRDERRPRTVRNASCESVAGPVAGPRVVVATVAPVAGAGAVTGIAVGAIPAAGSLIRASESAQRRYPEG